MESTVSASRRAALWIRIRKHKLLYILLLPAVLWVAVFSYLPLSGWIMAFKNYQLGVSIWDVEWIGLQSFRSFFLEASDAFMVIRNTLVINSLTIIINMVISCAFAILINEMRKNWFKSFVQMASFFPFFISWVVIYSIFHAFLGATSGALNITLEKLGIVSQGIDFLGDPRYSWPVILFVNCWRFIGYNSIIFLSSIAGIDQEQYESAEIDGAGRFGKIIHITIPGLLNTIIVLLIMNSGWLLSSNFEQFYLFTNSANMDTMQVFDIYIYKYGLQLLDFPYATAVGMIKTLVSILLIIGVNSISKKANGKSLF